MSKNFQRITSLLVLALFLFLSSLSYGQEKKVCFTFDDLPFVAYNVKDSSLIEETFNKLITTLSRHHIPATGFVNGMKLYKDGSPDGSYMEMLNNWAANGLDLGNHTFSHQDYNSHDIREFSQDILKGSAVINDIMGKKNGKLKYFRHPYLHVGNSKEKADSLTGFLKTHGYVTAPVTIDNDDYLFAAAFSGAMIRNDSISMDRIGRDFLSYTEQKLKYYERQTEALFNRDIRHIMLLHVSLLNSIYLPSIVALFESNNYSFISLDEALQDSVYSIEITRFGNWGISWIDRWALTQGKKGDFFKNEPVPPEY